MTPITRSAYLILAFSSHRRCREPRTIVLIVTCASDTVSVAGCRSIMVWSRLFKATVYTLQTRIACTCWVYKLSATSILAHVWGIDDVTGRLITLTAFRRGGGNPAYVVVPPDVPEFVIGEHAFGHLDPVPRREVGLRNQAAQTTRHRWNTAGIGCVVCCFCLFLSLSLSFCLSDFSLTMPRSSLAEKRTSQ